MPRGHLFAVCFQSLAGRAETPNGLALGLTAHAPPTQPASHRVQFGGSGQMGYRRREQRNRGRIRRGQVYALLLPIRAFDMPSRDPLLRTAHTSLGCQDNGQQARAVTPHFLCTEFSNHDRCRQSCHRRRYQGPLHFLSAWPRHRPTASGKTGQPGQS